MYAVLSKCPWPDAKWKCAYGGQLRNGNMHREIWQRQKLCVCVLHYLEVVSFPEGGSTLKVMHLAILADEVVRLLKGR